MIVHHQFIKKWWCNRNFIKKWWCNHHFINKWSCVGESVARVSAARAVWPAGWHAAEYSVCPEYNRKRTRKAISKCGLTWSTVAWGGCYSGQCWWECLGLTWEKQDGGGDGNLPWTGRCWSLPWMIPEEESDTHYSCTMKE